jgi:DNA polymerase
MANHQSGAVNYLFLDFETASRLDLTEVGLDNYARSARVLMLGWALNNDKIQLWRPDKEAMPEVLRAAVLDSAVIKVAWYTAFEHEIFRQALKIDIPIEQCRDAAVLARSLSMPGKLATVCEILKIGEDESKIADGDRLIELFCSPHFFKSPKSKKNIPGMVDDFYNEVTHPADWRMFEEYCIRDVEIERKLWLKFLPLSFPEEQWEDWFFDFRMNERGMPVNVERAKKALALAVRFKNESKIMLNEMTGLENANSPAQLMLWLQSEGYSLGSIEKKYVEFELNNPNSKLTPKAREVLMLRRKSAQNSHTKLETMIAMASPDGRLRHQFMFMGAARTGRWSAYGAQVMNMPRPIKAIKKMMPEEIFDLVDREAYDEILEKFDNSTLPFVASIIRMMFGVTT